MNPRLYLVNYRLAFGHGEVLKGSQLRQLNIFYTVQ